MSDIDVTGTLLSAMIMAAIAEVLSAKWMTFLFLIMDVGRDK